MADGTTMRLSETTWIRTIAVLEIVGGAVGILFMAYISIAAGFAFSAMVVVPISLGIFVLSLIAGIYLWRQQEFGRKASIVTQFIQLPKLISPAFTFTFSFGFDFFPHITFVDSFVTAGIQFRFLADGQLFINSQGFPIFLGISLPAIIALQKLWNYNPTNEGNESTICRDEPPPPDQYFGPASDVP